MLNPTIGYGATACVHHWLVASPSGIGVAMPASCKHCGAERDFEQTVLMAPHELYRNHPALGQPVDSFPVEYGLHR